MYYAERPADQPRASERAATEPLGAEDVAHFDRAAVIEVGQAEHCLSATKLILPARSEALGWSAGLSA